MDFDQNKPIYLQIVDSICERILSSEVHEGDRVLSVRELGAELGVNPNTVQRAYEKLTDMGVIFNKRGIGYFVADGAAAAVLAEERRRFLEDELPAIRKRMQLLGLDAASILSAE